MGHARGGGGGGGGKPLAGPGSVSSSSDLPRVLHGAEPLRDACVSAWGVGGEVVWGQCSSWPPPIDSGRGLTLCFPAGAGGGDGDQTCVMLNISALSRTRMGLCVASGPPKHPVLGWRSPSRSMFLLGRRGGSFVSNGCLLEGSCT